MRARVASARKGINRRAVAIPASVPSVAASVASYRPPTNAGPRNAVVARPIAAKTGVGSAPSVAVNVSAANACAAFVAAATSLIVCCDSVPPVFALNGALVAFPPAAS